MSQSLLLSSQARNPDKSSDIFALCDRAALHCARALHDTLLQVQTPQAKMLGAGQDSYTRSGSLHNASHSARRGMCANLHIAARHREQVIHLHHARRQVLCIPAAMWGAVLICLAVATVGLLI